MPDRAFFDTNILIYAFAAGDPRQGVALKLMPNGGAIGVQTLNEFVNVATGKLKIPWTELVARLGIIERLCDPAVPATLSVHRRGLEISQTLSYHLYDSLMLAAALEASCTVFYSEDLQEIRGAAEDSESVCHGEIGHATGLTGVVRKNGRQRSRP